MRFTERELTVAVDELAQTAYALGLSRWRRHDVASEWAALAPMEKYQHRVTVADTILPVLIALPDRPTVGAHPEFSDEEWNAAVTATLRAAFDAREPGSFDALPDRQRLALQAAATDLARQAIAAMPVRQDPDSFEVPDHL